MSNYNDLISLANKLDLIGESDIANKLDSIIMKSAEDSDVAFSSGGRNWFKSKPSTLREFNAYLAALIMGYNGGRADGQNLVNAENLSNIERTDPDLMLRTEAGKAIPNSWTRDTQRAFETFVRWAGEPYAADYPPGLPDSRKVDDQGRTKYPWVVWAEDNNYRPSLGGIYDFWVDNAQRVLQSGASYIGSRARGEFAQRETADATERVLRETTENAVARSVKEQLFEANPEHAAMWVDFIRNGYMSNDRGQQMILERGESWARALEPSSPDDAAYVRQYVASLKSGGSGDTGEDTMVADTDSSSPDDEARSLALEATKGDHSAIVSNYPQVAASTLKFPLRYMRMDRGQQDLGYYYKYARPPRVELVTEVPELEGVDLSPGDDLERRIMGRQPNGQSTGIAIAHPYMVGLADAKQAIRDMPSEGPMNARTEEGVEESNADDNVESDMDKLSLDFSIEKGLVRR